MFINSTTNRPIIIIIFILYSTLSIGQVNENPSWPSNEEERTILLSNQKKTESTEQEIEQDKKNREAEIAFQNQLDSIQLQTQNKCRNLLFILGIFSVILSLYLWAKHKEHKDERNNLLHRIELLNKKLTAQTISSPKKNKELTLDRVKIENHITGKLGESSWIILNLIFKNPSISNKEIASEVSLSLEGVSSSLRRMYSVFEINSSNSNKKIALIMKIVQISNKE